MVAPIYLIGLWFVRRALRYRFYPTEEQAQLLTRTFGCVRLVWNRALAYRTAAWYDRQERVNYNATSALLTGWKKADDLAFLNEVSSVPLQQCLRHQQKAFANFFEGRARYPRLKSKRSNRGSATYTRAAFQWNGQRLWLAKMAEPLDVRWSRPVPEGAEPSTVTVSVDPAGRWHVSILVDDPTVTPLPRRGEAVGVDLGVSALATLSTGEKVVGGKHLRANHARLARAQRALARKQKGSANRAKARRKVARVHARIADRRRDQLHKLTTRLVRENQTVVIEDLNVSGMVSNRSLARAISDQGWRELRRQLEYKADWYGRDLVVIDRWFPSTKRCSACGWTNQTLPLSVRNWACPQCGTVHDRDVNAAINIRAAGLAVQACGDGVRPARAKRGKAVVDETGNPDE